MRLLTVLGLCLALCGCGAAELPAPAPVVASPLSVELSSELSIETAALQSMPTVPDGPLSGFYSRLAGLGATQPSDVVRVLQLGDSHTAGDYLSGDLRDLLQTRFGNAGIGARAAGLPYLGVRQKDFTLGETGGWRYHNSLTDPGFADYGLSGFTAVSAGAGASLSLTPVDARGFDSAFVDFVRQPGGGGFQIWLDDTLVQTVSTAGTAGVMGHAVVMAPAGGAHQLEIVAKASGIEILDWSTQRFSPGVILDSFGVVGSTAGIVDNWNPDIVRRQLEFLHPALIILAYGTNEAAETDFDPAAYAAVYGGILAKLRRWSPASSILVEAPTDGARQDRSCTATEICPWYPLPALVQVRDIQKAAARQYGAAYYDNAAPMNISGGIAAWAGRDPPLARRDHIHFTVAGYRILAATLYVWLTNGFAAFQQLHPDPALN